jgi:hypothetical protein
MTSKYIKKIIPKKILKSCFKFVFLTKKFKGNNQHYVLKTFSKCNDYEYQNTRIIGIIEILKYMEVNKCFQV